MESARVSAISADLSLGVVVFRQWRETKRRYRDDEERQLKKERAQAEQVAAWVEGISAATVPDGEVDPASKGVSISVRNDSNLPVYDLLLVLVPAIGAVPRS